MPVALGVIVIIFAGQLLLRRDTPWMPKVLSRVKISKSKVDKARKFIRPVFSAIDRLVNTRLTWAATGAATVIAAIITIILALTMLPLGAVPFGVVIPGLIIGLFGLGIMARDGLIMLIAFTLSGGATVLIYHLISAIDFSFAWWPF